MPELFRAERVDDNCEQSWGNNTGIVVCVNTIAELEQHIKAQLMLSHCQHYSSCNCEPVTRADGTPINRGDINIKNIGVAHPGIKPGIILISNAGS